MERKGPQTTKAARTFDSAYSFSFAIALSLVLFIGGLIISLTLGEGTSVGLIFGIPMLVAGLVLPLIMMRDVLKHNVVNDLCPYCSVPIKTSDATIRLNCPACNRKVLVREGKLEPGE
jgi:DNA-directed RNA polymerase subunit RPC12/RpoP